MATSTAAQALTTAPRGAHLLLLFGEAAACKNTESVVEYAGS